MSGRMDWLSLLRGLNILLVVMFHVQLIDMTTGQNHALCVVLPSFFTPVRMPLFIFCSGGLLYVSRISRAWSVSRLYRDKVQRILVPFVFFVLVYYFFKLAVNPFVKTKVVFSLRNVLESFVFYEGYPSAPLWFLATLMTLMLLYPLFCWLSRRPVRMVIFLLMTVAFYFVEWPDGYQSYNYFYVLHLHRYLVYFFFGIFFFRYDLHRYTGNVSALLVLAVAEAVLYVFQVDLAVSLVGILLMVSFCQLLATRVPGLFGSFRDYIFQIYLMSFIFQAFVELVLWKRLFYNEDLFLLFYVLNIAFGVFFPVLIAKCVERCPIKAVRLCFGLK